MADEPKDESQPAPNAELEALKAKNAELVANNNKLSQKLQAFGDFTPETAAEAARKAKEAEEAKLSAAGQFEELKKRLQDEHRTSTEKLTAAIAERDKKLERLLVQSELDRAMDEVGVLPDAREYVRRYFLADAPKVKGDAGVFERADGDVPIAQAVKAWSESKDADRFVAADTRNGAGSRGSGDGSGGGAQKWGTMNDTQRAQLFKTNRDEARRLAREAGVNIAAA
jgi:hypothetical protein